ncbi:hypothetical protein [Microvirga brassicacearum]|uniref:Uncharacterized protein n=1 Tax=Microvirga brassicacearum TaxID=2580413 RepID=A0A5N3PH99_9HYPH|nr:hypothetical protein [Microvirga brassicacearum]KAB0269025.1 hypothetical protein FEZ63_02650 [Microvirga brassicacearum]
MVYSRPTAIELGTEVLDDLGNQYGQLAIHTARVITAQNLVLETASKRGEVTFIDPRVSVALALAQASIDILFTTDPGRVLTEAVAAIGAHDGIFLIEEAEAKRKGESITLSNDDVADINSIATMLAPRKVGSHE